MLQPFPAERNLTLNYHVVVSNEQEVQRKVKVWIPVFHSNDRQTVTLTTKDFHGGRLTAESKYGNQMLFIELLIAPNSKQEIDLEYVANIREWTNPAAKSLQESAYHDAPKAMKVYTLPTSMIPLDGNIKELANEVPTSPDGPISTARKIYDFLIDRMDYNYKVPGAGKGDAQWACGSRKGDCTDYHSLFIGLSRVKGIPAEHCFGVVFEPSGSK